MTLRSCVSVHNVCLCVHLFVVCGHCLLLRCPAVERSCALDSCGELTAAVPQCRSALSLRHLARYQSPRLTL